ncbi:MAG: DUF3108 domain-containing protein [Candidatus Competibacterales bacterium]|nr:DUF3108 domain-containing protein [Candidatus Competibacterales bacterium]
MFRWLTLLLLPLALPALAELPVRPFEAHYTVYARGFEVGTGLIALEATGGSGYRMRSALEATGLAELLFDDTIREQVEGRVNGRTIRPQDYRFERRGGDETEITEYRFDWSRGQVEALHNGRRAVLELAPRTIDPLSIYLQVMTDLSQGRRPDRFELLDELERKQYRVDYADRGMLDTALGAHEVLRVVRQRPGSSRRVEFWFAPALDYLPLQITQYKNDSENLRMSIAALRRD